MSEALRIITSERSVIAELPRFKPSQKFVAYVKIFDLRLSVGFFE